MWVTSKYLKWAVVAFDVSFILICGVAYLMCHVLVPLYIGGLPLAFLNYIYFRERTMAFTRPHEAAPFTYSAPGRSKLAFSFLVIPVLFVIKTPYLIYLLSSYEWSRPICLGISAILVVAISAVYTVIKISY